MKKVVFFFLLISLHGQASIDPLDPLILNVEKEMNNLLRGTVSEVESRAEVLRLHGSSQIKCSNLIYNKGRKIVFCNIDIKVSDGKSGLSKSTATCTSLGYILDKKGVGIESQYNSESFLKCMETISDMSLN